MIRYQPSGEQIVQVAPTIVEDASPPVVRRIAVPARIVTLFMVADGVTQRVAGEESGGVVTRPCRAVPRAQPIVPVIAELPAPPAPFGLADAGHVPGRTRWQPWRAQRWPRTAEELPTPPAPTPLEESSGLLGRLRRPSTRRAGIAGETDELPRVGLGADNWSGLRIRPKQTPRRLSPTSEELPAPPAPFALEDESWTPPRRRSLARRLLRWFGTVAELAGLIAPPITVWILAAKGGPRYQLTARGGARYTLIRRGLVDSYIALADDHTIEYDIKEKNTQTRVVQAATGLTGVNGWIALTPTGAAIAGTTVALAEAASKPGTYFGAIDRAAVNTALGAMVGQFVYEVIDDGDDLKRVRRLRVVATREA